MSDARVPAEWFEGSFDNNPLTEAGGPGGADPSGTAWLLAVGAALVAGLVAFAGGGD